MSSLPPLTGPFSARSPRAQSQMELSRPSSTCSSRSTLSHKPLGVTRSQDRFFYPSPRRGRPDSGFLPTLRSGSGSVLSRYSGTYHTSPRMALKRTSSEECLKCMLKVPHKKCEAHKYIRVGGGYRHSYWYIRTMMEDLEQQLWEEQLLQRRLEAINESSVRAVKTYIRTKSGRLVERIVFLTEEDYQAMQAGGDAAAAVLKRYLTDDEAKNLDSWDNEEVKAIKTFVRTKSGKLIEKLVYISKGDYDKIKGGEMSAGDVMKVLKKYVKTENGERIDGWGEAQMKQVKTYVRTKSGRLVEKIIMVSKEDYDKLVNEGGDPAKILGKYLSTNEGETIESWKKADKPAMKVIKTYVRTKSGRLVEKTILMTEDEYKEFEASGGDLNTLKRYLKLGEGETVEDWEKASTVYGASSDEETAAAKPGQRIVGKDGAIYEVLVDPITGKKYKKKVTNFESDVDSGIGSTTKGRHTGKTSRSGAIDGISEEEAIEREKRARKKQGKRQEGSDSEYSYKSEVSVGGTRRVTRRKKNADGTRGDAESYHSSQDEDGQERRRRRRRERKHGGSAHSYYSVESAGGTRHVRRRKKKADGTYAASESYHSSDSEYYISGKGKGTKGKGRGGKGGKDGKGGRKEKKLRKVRHEHGSDSEYSYMSEVSEGGTKRRKRKKRIRDADGNVIGHAESEAYTSPSEYTTATDQSDSSSSYYSESDGKGGRIRKKKEKSDKKGKKKKGKKGGAGDSSTDFSDATTDSEAVDLSKMTEEEKRVYFEEKAKRKAAREKRRREKYGDRYDEIMEKHEKKKLEKEKFKSMVSYEKGAGRGLDPTGKTDGREPGMGLDEWGKPKGRKGKKYKDGNEADSESEDLFSDVDGRGSRSSYQETIYDDEGNPIGKVRRKGHKGKGGYNSDDSDYIEEIGPDGKKIRRPKVKKQVIVGSDGEEYEVETDAKGNILKKKKKKKNPDDSSGSEYEYQYDKDGNLIGTKKIKKKKKGPNGKEIDSESDGDYFEKDADGKIRLKAGKKKIDISKLTDDQLRALGIDPTLSKQEIARQLKEKFGDDIIIKKAGEKIGLKNVADYGSDADTDDLANDSDLDTSTLTGKRRMNVLLRRGGQKLQDHMKKIVEDSKLNEEKVGDEKDSSIDFLTHYRLVDPRKLEGYARSFAVEDDDYDAVIRYRDMRTGMQGIPSLSEVDDKQMDYVCKVLRVDKNSNVSFRMFAVISSLAERVTKMDSHCQQMLKVCNLMDIERKLDLYRAMFFWNTTSDRDPNYIKSEALKIELIAGGLSWPQQDYIMEQLQPNEFFEISFLDYICYIPLFLSFHDNICDNPLDMSNSKYTPQTRRVGSAKRDMNPLGNHLKKNSPFQMRLKANELLDGKKPDVEAVKQENLALLEMSKNQKLPDIIDSKMTKQDKKTTKKNKR